MGQAHEVEMGECCHMMMKKLIQAEEGERGGGVGVKVDRQETA